MTAASLSRVVKGTLLLAGLALPVLARALHADPGPRSSQGSVPGPSLLGVVPKPYSLNNPVLEFRLADLAGKEHLVAGPRDERLVLLVFWSFRDPPSRFYVPELVRLQETHRDRLALYLIDSNADELTGGNADPLDRVRRWVADEEVPLTILIDRDNHIADDFAAIANGQVFLIDGNRTLRYQGGLDDDPDGARAKAKKPVAKWLDQALAELLEGRLPTVPLTRPAGRPLKRLKQADGQ